MNGMGVITYKDGRRYAGEWKDNQMSGKGVYSWRDGRKYEGYYFYDKKVFLVNLLIFSMDLELLHGPTGGNMRDNGNSENKMEKVTSIFLMEL